MNEKLKILLFVFVLAIITSGVLLGVEALTAERIENNQDAKIKSAILDANDISYTLGSINETFENDIAVVVIDGFTFYVNPTTNAITFEFGGNGVWGPIEGILTLDSDFETILNVSILQQEETPGLGGEIAGRQYLDTFVGKVMVPQFEINKDPSPNEIYEIDSITGATNTSKRVEKFLNADYEAAKALWQSQVE